MLSIAVSQTQGNLIAANRTLGRLEDMQANNTAHFQRWNASIADGLQELRDKIAKARHAADAIRISVQSKPVASSSSSDDDSGSCIRSYIPRIVGLTTSNTIRLSVALNPNAASTAGAATPLLFVQGAVAGTFIALELRQRRVHLAWNLGGNTGQLTHTVELQPRDPKYNDAWYQIAVNRTMNLATLSVAQMDAHGALRPTRSLSGSTSPEHTRLLVSGRDSRLWLGGVPAGIRPAELAAGQRSTAAAPLAAIVHKLHVDGEPVGLWNFAHSQGACAGAVAGAHETSTSAFGSASWHFNGHGYATVQKKSRRMMSRERFAMQLIFRTFDENALLFLAVDESTNRSVSLTLHRGRLTFRIDYGNASKLEIGTAQRYNDGNWTKVEVARHFAGGTESGMLTVPHKEERSGSPTTPIARTMLPNLSKAVYYVGGVPPGFRSGTTKAPGADHAFLGCMRDIQVNGETYDPMESTAYFGVEPNCRAAADAITMAGFHGSGWLALPAHSLRKRANFGLVLRTRQPDALVLVAMAGDATANYSVALVGGRAHVWLQTAASAQPVRLAANGTLNDGEYHVVAVQKSGCRVELRVDDRLQDAGRLEPQGCAVLMGAGGGSEARMYLGGAPDVWEKYADGLAPTFARFEGTIRDVVFNNATVAFEEQLGFAQVQLGRAGPPMGELLALAAGGGGGGAGGSGGGALAALSSQVGAGGAGGVGGGGGAGEAASAGIGRSFAAVPEGCSRVSAKEGTYWFVVV